MEAFTHLENLRIRTPIGVIIWNIEKNGSWGIMKDWECEDWKGCLNVGCYICNWREVTRFAVFIWVKYSIVSFNSPVSHQIQ